MNWKSQDGKNKVRPHGSYRIVKKFFWWPESVGDSVFWLSSVWVIQQRLEYEDGAARWFIEAKYDGLLENIEKTTVALNEKILEMY